MAGTTLVSLTCLGSHARFHRDAPICFNPPPIPIPFLLETPLLSKIAPPRNLSLSTIYIDPSKSHIFVGGVRDIIAPAPQQSRTTKQQPKGSGTGGSDGRQKSWGDRAWGLMAAGGMGCGADNAEGGAVSDDDDDESCATEEDGGGNDGEGGMGCGDDDEEGCGGARDVRAFATTLIEMVLK